MEISQKELRSGNMSNHGYTNNSFDTDICSDYTNVLLIITFFYLIGSANAQTEVDSDGDGLIDTWETNGIPYVGNDGVERYYVLPEQIVYTRTSTGR